MRLNTIDRVGELNPQLFRELKGKLKQRNLAIVVVASLLSQLLLLFSFYQRLPVYLGPNQAYTNLYCTGKRAYDYGKDFFCFRRANGDFVINWQSWSLDVFAWLSIITLFVLIVGGTFLLINDLDREERRGTLNFIRLSPRSTSSIFLGKMLGVPILLYLAAALAIPLHLWLGINANISIFAIFGFYIVLAISCLFFYSAALLFGSVSSWLGGFQPWLGGGAILGFLWSMTALMMSNMPFDHPFVWVMLLNPVTLIPHLFESSLVNLYSDSKILTEVEWFYIPLGISAASLIGFAIANWAIFTCWIWISLERCFRNPNATMLSKQQSYLFTACFAIITAGFAFRHDYPDGTGSPEYALMMQFAMLAFLDLGLFLYLIAALSPHRQALCDWARYRQLHRAKFWRDLVKGEKSPALVAIGINLAIASAPLALIICLSSTDLEDKLRAFYSLILAVSLVAVYAAIAQLMLLMKTQHRILWAIGAVGTAIVFPVAALGLLAIDPNSTMGFFWLLTVCAPAIPLTNFPSEMMLLPSTIGLGILAHWAMTSIISLRLGMQLQQVGESASKALLAQKI